MLFYVPVSIVTPWLPGTDCRVIFRHQPYKQPRVPGTGPCGHHMPAAGSPGLMRVKLIVNRFPSSLINQSWPWYWHKSMINWFSVVYSSLNYAYTNYSVSYPNCSYMPALMNGKPFESLVPPKIFQRSVSSTSGSIHWRHCSETSLIQHRLFQSTLSFCEDVKKLEDRNLLVLVTS